jgi:O-antigen ligase
MIAGGFIFLLCVALFAYTNLYLILAVPFALLVLIWPFLNLRSFFWFFIFTIPFSCTIYFFHEALSTTFPDESLMWLLLCVSVCLISYNYKIIPQWFLRHPFVLIIALQFVWLTIAVIFSQDILISLKYYVAKIWFLNAFIFLPVLIFQKKKDFKIAFLLFAVPVTLHALFVFGWHYTLHFSYLLANKVVFPFYQNHVDYSTVLSMLFPLWVVAFQLVKGKKWYRWLIGLIILFYILAIYVASARAAMLGVVFAFGINFMIRKKKVQWVMPSIYVVIAVAVFLLAYNNNYIALRPNKKFVATQPTFFKTVTGTFTGKDMSSMERFYRWIAAVRMSRDHPVTGVGPNNFYDYYKPYTVQMFSTWVSRNDERSTTHNYFLFMLVEQGWPAMLLYAILLIVVFKRAQNLYHRLQDPFYKKVAMGLIMMFAAGFVNNFFSELLEDHKVGFLFYGSISLLIVVEHLAKKEKALE